MKELNLSVEIHALHPRWISIEQPKYRRYVNNDLITERTWTWDQDTYIEEKMSLCVPTQIRHNISLELIKSCSTHLSQLGLSNLKINGSNSLCNSEHSMSLSFNIL